jgi:hypothetical protein
MMKWVINRWYKNSPECICGYKMKPINCNRDLYNWKCIWVKKCGWEASDSGNGKLSWKK